MIFASLDDDLFWSIQSSGFRNNFSVYLLDVSTIDNLVENVFLR